MLKPDTAQAVGTRQANPAKKDVRPTPSWAIWGLVAHERVSQGDLLRAWMIAPSRRELLIATGLSIFFGGRARANPSVPRRLKLKHLNTGESFEGPYRDASGPLPDAISDLAQFLRDFHVNKVGPIDVGTLDFLADVLDAVGETSASVLSAYRTHQTNEWLRATRLGVAERSQHLYGRAIDISMGRLADAEVAARRMACGGVGWYPRSHFIHLDTGPLRAWQQDGSGLQSLLAGRTQPVTTNVAREVKSIDMSAGADRSPMRLPVVVHGSALPPCRQTETAGVLITRGKGCVP